MIAEAEKLGVKDDGLADLSVLVDGFLQLIESSADQQDRATGGGRRGRARCDGASSARGPRRAVSARAAASGAAAAIGRASTRPSTRA